MTIATGEQALAADVIKLGAGIYGNGADGNVTIAGATDLARDMYYDTLTVNNGQVLSTKGFRIFAKTAVICVGTIDNSGGVGGNGVAGTGGAAGAGAATGSLGGGTAGGIGKTDGGTCGASGGGGGGGGVIFIAAKTITNTGTIRANGGNAGTPTSATDVQAINGTDVAVLANAFGSKGGAGGNADANTGGTTTATTPPAATEGGYKDVVSLRELRLTSAHTQISGGSGGGSGAVYGDDAGNGAAGGSGGGGGGLVVLIYRDITLGTVQVNGGAHSDGAVNGIGTKTDGADGTAGTIIQLIT